MGWKIFAVFFAILSLWGVFDARSYETTWEAIGLVLTLPAPIGLLLFAFNKSFLPRGFWKAFAVIYIAYSAVVLVIAIQRWVADHDQSGKSIWIYMIAFAVSFALQFLVSLGYGGIPYGPLNRSDDFLLQPLKVLEMRIPNNDSRSIRWSRNRAASSKRLADAC